VPPLLATVGINGKVSFLEKSGTSEFSNSTGAYELDLSLVDDFDHAWREMHVKTDLLLSYFQTRLRVSSMLVAGLRHRRLASGFMPPTVHLASTARMIGRKIQAISNSREDVGIRRPLFFPMAVSSLWVER